MYNYKGISMDILTLLELNRFNNSKAFYEEHKKEINEGARQQMGALSLDLADTLYDIDEDIFIDPKRVSRIRRDTRFTKDKTLYRSHIWTEYRIPKENGPTVPCFWAEVSPESWSCGVGIWCSPPSMMELFRKRILENPGDFASAILSVSGKGYVSGGKSYKRDKSGTDLLPEPLRKFYNLKEVFFVKESYNLLKISDSGFVNIMKNNICEMKEMYIYLKKLYTEYKALGGE